MGELKMPEINRVSIAGRLTGDAKQTQLNDGNVAEFNIAVDESFKGHNGTWEKRTAFFAVKLWKPSEQMLAGLYKGRPVHVEGRLSQETWQDKATGQKREKTKITAIRVQFLDWPTQNQSGSAQAQSTDDEIPF